MSDTSPEHVEKVKSVVATLARFSDEMSEALGKSAEQMTVNYHLTYGDVETFTSAVACALAVAQASLVQLIRDGFVTLTEKGEATEEQRAKRDAAGKARLDALLGGQVQQRPFGSGGAYL